MIKYVVKKVAVAAITVFALITIVFFLVRLLPGDPFTDPKTPEEIRQKMISYYGLDRPITEQYIIFLKNLSHGDLGYSLKYRNMSVNSIILNAFPYSADLGIRGLIFAVVAGLFLGIVAALNQNRKWDHISMIIAILGISIPSFIIGSVLQYFLGVKLKVLPVAQWKTFAHTLIPSFAVGIGTLALIARLMRANMLEVIGEDYIRTAKAKGLSQVEITVSHQIRNAILPVITILGPTTASLLTGTFVIESIFAIPGLGRHYVYSIQNLDYTLVLGLTIVFGVFLVVMQLLVDIVYGLVDPRIRVGS